MITDIVISFNKDQLAYSIQIPEADDNIPYNLADVFAELIRQTNANEEIVIEQLINEFGYNKEGKDND